MSTRVNPIPLASAGLAAIPPGRRLATLVMMVALVVVSACSDSDRSPDVEVTSQALTNVEVLGFEDAEGWAGELGPLSANRTEGQWSLPVPHNATSGVASAELSPLGAVADTVTLDIWIPDEISHYGDTTLVLTSPDQALWGHRISGPSMAGAAPQQWLRIEFPLENVKSKVEAAQDLTVAVVTNLPEPTSGPYLLDRLDFYNTPDPGTGGTGAGGLGGAASGGIGQAGGPQGGTPTGGVPPTGGTSSGGVGGLTGGAPTGGVAGNGGSGATGNSGGTGGEIENGYTYEFVVRLPEGMGFSEPTLTGSERLYVNSGDTVTEPGGGYGTVVHAGSSEDDYSHIGAASHIGDVWSAASVLARSQSTIHGDVWTQDTFSKQDESVTVEGEAHENAPFATNEVKRWSVTFDNDVTRSRTVLPPSEEPNPAPLSPGRYHNLRVSADAVVQMPPGTYFVVNLTLEPGSQLVADNATGPIVIYIRNQINFHGTIERTDPEAYNILVGYAGENTLHLEAPFAGTFVSPDADLVLASLNGNGMHAGSFFAKGITTHQWTNIEHRPFCGEHLVDCSICECGSGQGPCESADECAEGLVCNDDVAWRFDLTEGTPVCLSTSCLSNPSLACGSLDHPCGRCGGAKSCGSNRPCPSGYVCGASNGQLFNSIAENVCWPALCETDAVSANCGKVSSPCGVCACTPNCGTKSCGDVSDDGCGSICEGICDNEEAGCQRNEDCTTGYCAIGQGPAVGQPEGTNVCLPPACQEWDPSRVDCGTPESDCPVCPTCVAECGERDCGPDPVCGESCGSCGPGFACEAGTCITSSYEGRGADEPPNSYEIARKVPGSVPGGFGVSEEGAASYQIPFTVPPGRGGLQPSVGLNYNSNHGDGQMGVGWSLGGISQITRCPPALRTPDDVKRGVEVDSNDAFCLDGKRLALVSGTYGEDGAEYRTEVDTFLKVKSLGSSGRGPKYFKVWTGDGTVKTYGDSDESSVFADRYTGSKRAWAIHRVETVAGNTMVYEYRATTGVNITTEGGALCPHSGIYCGTLELRMERIAYSGHTNGYAPDRSIRFHYESREHPVRGFSAGSLYERPVLLTRVDTMVQGERVRSYHLHYVGARNGSPILQSVYECAPESPTEDICKKPTRFEYSHGHGFDVPKVSTSEPKVPTKAPLVPFYLSQDPSQALMVRTSNDSKGRWERWYLGGNDVLRQGGGGFSMPYSQIYAVVDSPSSQGEELIGEVPELEWPERPPLPESPEDEAPEEVWEEYENALYAYESSGGHSFDDAPRPRKFSFVPQTNEVGDAYPVAAPNGDFDGDGRRDLFRSEFHRNTSVGTTQYDAHEVANINGAAGGVDTGLGFSFAYVVATDGDPWRGWVLGTLDSLNTVQVGPPGLSMPSFMLAIQHPFTVDSNGDGLRDLLVRTQQGLSLYLNTGRMPHKAAPFALPFRRHPIDLELDFIPLQSVLVMDWNRDGREDIIYPSTSSDGKRIGETWLVSLAEPDGGYSYSEVLFNFETARVWRAVLADVNGDGVRDFVGVNWDGYLVTALNKGAATNLLKRVTDGMGVHTEIEYDVEDLDQEEPTHTPTPNADWPVEAVRRPPPLVKSYRVGQQTDSGLASFERSYELTYEGARRDHVRDVWLGFDRRTVEVSDGDGNTLSTTYTEYVNPQPYLTNPDEEWNYTYPLAGKVERSTTVYPPVESDLTETRASRIEEVVNTWEVGTSTRGGPFPYLWQATRRVEDEPEGGSPTTIASTYREIQVDDYGAVTGSATNTHEQHSTGSLLVDSTVSATTYSRTTDQLDRWQIALPDRVTVTSIVDGDINTRKTRATEYAYTDGLLVSTTQEPDGGSEFCLRDSVVQRDDYNNVIRTESSPCGEASNARWVEASYDDTGTFVESTTTPVGTEWAFTDLGLGVIYRSIDTSGLEASQSFDPFGRVVSYQSPTGQGTIRYDHAQEETSSNITIRARMRVSLDAVEGEDRIQEVDTFGRVVRTRVTGLDGAWVVSEVEYDRAGRPSRVLRPHLENDTSQGVITYEYDAQQRLRAVIMPGGRHIEYHHASAATLSSGWSDLLFDQSGVWVSAIRDPMGYYSVTVANGAGRTTKVRDAKGGDTTYEYGAFGQVTKVIGPEGQVLREALYDTVGRLTWVQDANGGTQQVLEYSPFGEPLIVDEPRGTTTLDYDNLGRVIQRTDPDGAYAWEYDSSNDCPSTPRSTGQLIRTVSPDGHTTCFSYDNTTGLPNGAVLYVAVDGTLPDPPEVFSSRVTYNSYGLVDSLELRAPGANPFEVKYAYDGYGHQTTVANAATPEDPIWELTEAYQGYLTRRQTLQNGIEEVTGFDPDTGWITSISTLNSDIPIRTYHYDDNGNVDRVTDGATEPWHYIHDELNRLQRVWSGAPDEGVLIYDFVYTPNGNIGSSSTVGTYDYTWPNGTTPHAVRTAGGYEFGYDDVGNMTERAGPRVPKLEQQSDYTMFNLPRRAVNGTGTDTEVIDLEYNANGARVFKRVGGASPSPNDKRIHYGPGGTERHTSAAGATEYRFPVYAGGRQIAQWTGESLLYVHQDKIGSVVAATDENGDTVLTRRYTPFGQIVSTDPKLDILSRGFGGHEHDEDLGLINMGGRTYDPVVARFTSVDPITTAPFYSQDLNGYSYGWNSPLGVVDPTGLQEASGDFDVVLPEQWVWGELRDGPDQGSGGHGPTEATEVDAVMAEAPNDNDPLAFTDEFLDAMDAYDSGYRAPPHVPLPDYNLDPPGTPSHVRHPSAFHGFWNATIDQVQPLVESWMVTHPATATYAYQADRALEQARAPGPDDTYASQTAYNRNYWGATTVAGAVGVVVGGPSVADDVVAGASTATGNATRGASEGANIVYRGLAAGEDAAAGLVARAPEATNSVVSHVAGARASQWISTTRSLEIATTRFGKNGVVAIDLSKVSNRVVDLTSGIPGLGRDTMLSRWAVNAQEVLIQGGVPAAAITIIR